MLRIQPKLAPSIRQKPRQVIYVRQFIELSDGFSFPLNFFKFSFKYLSLADASESSGEIGATILAREKESVRQQERIGTQKLGR